MLQNVRGWLWLHKLQHGSRRVCCYLPDKDWQLKPGPRGESQHLRRLYLKQTSHLLPVIRANLIGVNQDHLSVLAASLHGPPVPIRGRASPNVCLQLVISPDLRGVCFILESLEHTRPQTQQRDVNWRRIYDWSFERYAIKTTTPPPAPFCPTQGDHYCTDEP